MTTIISTCEYCKEEFETPERSDRVSKFCSRQCFHASRRGVARPDLLNRQTNVCVVCNKEFETGGRTYRSRDQKFCSRTCKAMASVKQSSAKTLTVEQACYFAGLMDGEGSITAAKDNGKRITWRISVINCVKGIVDWCSDVTGVGTMHERAPRNSRQHITYTWQCYSWNAEFVLRQIYPYLLHPEKRRRAELLFAQMDEIRALGIKEPL